MECWYSSSDGGGSHSRIPHFQPNDTYLTDVDNLHIITGPTMAGKTSYLKQVGPCGGKLGEARGSQEEDVHMQPQAHLTLPLPTQISHPVTSVTPATLHSGCPAGHHGPGRLPRPCKAHVTRAYGPALDPHGDRGLHRDKLQLIHDGDAGASGKRSGCKSEGWAPPHTRARPT